jgi:hypothetical protein
MHSGLMPTVRRKYSESKGDTSSEFPHAGSVDEPSSVAVMKVSVRASREWVATDLFGPTLLVAGPVINSYLLARLQVAGTATPQQPDRAATEPGQEQRARFRHRC